jgi:hypothetical protein
LIISKKGGAILLPLFFSYRMIFYSIVQLYQTILARPTKI